MQLKPRRSLPITRWARTLVAWAACAQLALAASSLPRYLNRPDSWYAGEEARRIAERVLSHQSDPGGWPKNKDTAATPFTGDRKKINPTFDNGATTGELRFLARLWKATKDERYRDAFTRGVEYILKAQYPNGGWPQSYPPGKGYPRHITFNDGAMVRLMEFLRDVCIANDTGVLDAARRDAAQAAFERGVQCILKCQIKTNGILTAWCAQHDEQDFAPRSGRTYELASLSGAESVGIV